MRTAVLPMVVMWCGCVVSNAFVANPAAHRVGALPARQDALSYGQVQVRVPAPAAAGTALLAKKKGRGGQANEGATPRERKQKDDVIEVEGVVVEGLPNAMFKVEVGATGQTILCTISGRIRKNFVRIIVGDPVRVELSPYDLTRGRITFRYRK